MIKLTITFIFLFVLSINTDNHKDYEYANYHNNYAERSFFIHVYGKYISDYTVYIEIMSFDAKYTSSGFILHKNQINNFITALDSAKCFYTKWKSSAIENKGANSVLKRYYNGRIGGYFNAVHKPKMKFKIQPIYKYRIVKNKKGLHYILSISTGRMRTQYRNHYTTKKFAIFFTSVEEIDTFINLLKIKNINDYLLTIPE